MRKFVSLFAVLMLPLGAWAQSSANMDAANQAIISSCRAEGGTFISYKDDKCEYSGCAYVGKNGDVSYDGDNQRVSGGCDLKTYQSKAKSAYKAEIDKKIKDLEEQKKNADRIGKRPGDGSVEYGDLNGDGVIDDKDRAIAEERIRNSAGAQSGAQSGAQAGAQSGSGSGQTTIGDDGRLYCEELEGAGVIEKGGLCYNECKPKRSFPIFGKKKEGFERKACVECLLKYPGVYNVKKEYLPKDKNGKVIGDKSVSLGKGVTVKTGVIICKDSKGNIVSHTGTICPSGMTVHSGGTPSGNVTVIGGSTAGVAGGANGSVVVVGGVAGGVAGGSANGGLTLPAFCSSTKKKDKEACSAWISANARFLCASSATPAACMGGDYSDIMARYSVDGCVNCGGRGSNRGSTLSGVAEIVGAVAGPLAHFGSAWVGARAYQKGQEAWAGAAVAGFEQCQLSQNNYLQYLQANELPGMTPDQRNQMNCNGYQLGGYAGLGGAYGGYYAGGYSPGFMGGMMGPYGGYNPYGMGGYVGGSIGGSIGGIGMATGMVGGGICGAAGCQYPGMAGGYVAGGYVAGGYAGGMYTSGYAGGYAGGMYTSGYAGGMAGGFVNGISLAGGYNGGYAGGMYTSGYAGGYAGGMYTSGYAGGMAGGMVNGGYLAGGYNGGMYPGYGGIGVGGWGSGAGQWGMGTGMYGQGNNYYASQQAANIDGMLQQQGVAYQMGQMSGGMSGYGGFGGAGMYPSNMGFGLNMNIGGGMYGGFNQ